jgi:hypothetical protein
MIGWLKFIESARLSDKPRHRVSEKPKEPKDEKRTATPAPIGSTGSTGPR